MIRPAPRAVSTLSLTLVLAACASGGGGGGGAPDPIIDAGTGSVAAPRNLVLEEISFRSGADRRGVPETYDVAARTLVVGTEANGARVFVDSVQTGFGTGQSMRYDPATNQFSFAIDYTDEARDGAGPQVVMSETFGPLLLVTPKDLDDLDSGLSAVYLATQPQAYAVDPALIGGSVAAADAYLTRLREALEANGDAVEDGRRVDEILASVERSTARIEAGPGFFYEANGVTYYQYRTDGGAAPTRFVAAGEWETFDADGTQRIGHLVFGQRTAPSEMPQTGTAGYVGTITGSMIRQNDLQSLRGGFNMQTDFATGAVTMQMDANIAYRNGAGATEYIDYAEFEGTGDIDGAAFSGVMDGTVDRDAGADAQDVLTGSFEGEFFGPTAQEAGGTFEFSGADAAGAGAFVAADPNSNASGQ